MLLYRYDKDTKEYIGCLGDAQIDPLETQLRGEEVVVIPPCCTTKEPKILEENTVNVFDETKGDWKVVSDFRGLKGFNSKTKEVITITEIGNLPEMFVEELPKSLQDYKIEKIKEVKEVYESALKEDIKVGKIKYPMTFQIPLKQALETSEFNVLTLENPNNDEDTLTLNKKDAKAILKTMNLKQLLLPIRKKELIKDIKKLRSLDKLESFEIDFNLDKEIKKLLNKSKEKIEEYILEKSK